MSQLADLRDRLKLGLSEKPPEGRESVAVLAERIKALRAENALEAAPERTGARKKVTGEARVTARIRGRRDRVETGSPVADAAENAACEVPPLPEDAPPPPPLADPVPLTRHRVALRRDGARQMRMF